MKRLIICIIGIIIVVSVCVGVNYNNRKIQTKNNIAESKQIIVDEFVNEAKQRVDNAKEKPVFQSSISLSSQSMQFPEKFDLRAVDRNGDGILENYVTSVKYQNPFGTCWAFGAISAAETSILYELGQEAVVQNEDGTLSDTLDLSEHHTGWFVYTPIPEGDEQAGEGMISQVEGVDENPSLRLNSGSTNFAATAIFASGIGPVLEPDFDTAKEPESQLNYHGKNKIVETNANTGVQCYSKEDDWSIDESQRFRQSYMLDDAYYLLSPVSFNDNGYDIEYADMVNATYKEQLMNGRSISISYCADNYMPYKVNKAAKYINNETWAHYCYEYVGTNHVVAIVGWDDTYPKENFLTQIKQTDENGELILNKDGTPKMKEVAIPPKDGAWIVKNSWGSNDSWGKGLNKNSWGDNGYFYLSYYDQSINDVQCFDFDVKNELKKQLGQYSLEEYDYMPSELPHSITVDFPVASGNVFNIEQDETIKAISCVTTKANEEIEIYVFNCNNEQATLLGTSKKVFDKEGLHVVRLENHYPVKNGDRIGIVIFQKSDDKYVISVGSEYNKKGYDAGFCCDNYATNAVVNEKESYLYLLDNDCWIDFKDVLNEIETLDGPTSYLTYDNFPIKAYASLD